MIIALAGALKPSGSGGIALVQSASGTTADGSAGLTVNFGVPVTAGNSVIALIGTDNVFDPTSATVQLVGGGAEFLNIDYYATNADILIAYIQSVHNVTGGETGATLTTDAAVRASMQIIEVSGLADAAAEDTSTNTNPETGTLAFAEVTPTSANNLIVGIGAIPDAISQYASGPTTPFARLGTGVGGATVFQEAVYAIQSSATPQSTNMDIGINGDYAIATAAAAFGGA